MSLDVIYEDNHLLVVNKPAALATMGALPGVPTLVERAKEYLKIRYQKPGKVYLGVVSRLDAKVSGVIVLARTSKAAARLTEQFRSRSVSKTYWAIVTDRQDRLPDSGRLQDWVRKRDEQHRMVICRQGDAAAQHAELAWTTLGRQPPHKWLEIHPITGRKHQIRLQLSAADCPIVGDKKYASTERFENGIALHSRALALEHPVRREPLKFEAPLPDHWRSFAKLTQLNSEG